MNLVRVGDYGVIRLHTLVAILALLVQSVAAQQKCDELVGTIRRVSVLGDRTLDVNFTKAITPDDLKNNGQAGTWIVVDITESTTERPYRVLNPVERNDSKPMGTSEIPGVLLVLNQSLDRTHEYRVFQTRLTFQGCPLKAALEGVIPIKKDDNNSAGTPGQQGGGEGGFKLWSKKESSKGREDSNVYLSGTIEGARGSKTQFSTDIKLDLPHPTNGFFGDVGPYFNLKASTAEGADANSMSFGVKLRTGRVFPRGVDKTTGKFVEPDTRLLTGITFDLTPGFESDRRFRNVNTLLGNRLYFVTNSPRLFGKTLGDLIYLQPFIGYEIGRNIKSPVGEAEGRGLSRALIGGSFYLNLTPRKTNGLSLQVDYLRRFLLRREVSFEEDDMKKLVPRVFGRSPKDYLKATFEFGFSDFTGVSVNYEYGRLPPNFNLVNHKFSFGLVHKFKTKLVP
ncbi:MAG TPA: hypothetical protein VF656_18990 [Pyrinomonadaceae bacterium]